MIEPAGGVLLIAEPFLKDPNFLRSVVFVCEHKQEGTVGFILNRRFKNTIDELVPELEGIGLPVYYGGPVQTNTIHFLHQCPEEIPGGEEVINGVYWGGDFDLLVRHIRNQTVDPGKIKFYIGYSGWGEGQLDDEMKENTWLTLQASENLVFHTSDETIWKAALQELGGDYERMVNFPIDPQLN